MHLLHLLLLVCKQGISYSRQWNREEQQSSTVVPILCVCVFVLASFAEEDRLCGDGLRVVYMAPENGGETHTKQRNAMYGRTQCSLDKHTRHCAIMVLFPANKAR